MKRKISIARLYQLRRGKKTKKLLHKKYIILFVLLANIIELDYYSQCCVFKQPLKCISSRHQAIIVKLLLLRMTM